MMAPKGQRDYSAARLSRHALERFVERFGVEATAAEPALRAALTRTRRLGRNPSNDAVAVLARHGEQVVVAIFHASTCLTVLTWPQFEPRLAEFGRPRLPRKPGRMLRRLAPDQCGSQRSAVGRRGGQRSGDAAVSGQRSAVSGQPEEIDPSPTFD